VREGMGVSERQGRDGSGLDGLEGLEGLQEFLIFETKLVLPYRFSIGEVSVRAFGRPSGLYELVGLEGQVEGAEGALSFTRFGAEVEDPPSLGSSGAAGEAG